MSWMVGPVDDPDRYELHVVVGGGAEGQVWRATRRLTDGPLDVAVKVLSPTAGFDPVGDRERWEAQVARLRSFRHPGIVAFQEGFVGAPPHEAGQAQASDLQAYLVMSFVDGPSLADWLRANPGVGVEQRLAVLATAAGALDELHARGFVHSDVKPDNIRIATSGAHALGVLVDFGLMRAITGAEPERVAGTPGFWAPEVARGESPSKASDLFGFAATVLFVLTGARPAQAGSPEAVGALLAANPATAGDVDLERALQAALQPDPDNRPVGVSRWLSSVRGSLSSTGATTFIAAAPTDVAPIVTPPPPVRRRGKAPLVIAAVLLLVVLAAGAALALANRGGDETEVASESTTIPAETSTRLASTTSSSSSTSSSTSTTVAVTTTLAVAPLTDTDGNPITDDVIYLDQVRPVAGSDKSDGAVKANAVQYLHPVSISTSCGTPTSIEYDLGRAYKSLKGTLAFRDDASSSAKGFWSVYVDGKQAFTKSQGLGASLPLDLDITGILRLKIENTNTTAASYGCSDDYFVWGDLRIER